MCRSQCVSLFAACGGARFTEVNDAAYATAQKELRLPINEAFKDGAELCNWLGYDVAGDPETETSLACYRQLETNMDVLSDDYLRAVYPRFLNPDAPPPEPTS